MPAKELAEALGVGGGGQFFIKKKKNTFFPHFPCISIVKMDSFTQI